MLSPNGFAASLNGPAHWQCRYSGCTQRRHTRPSGALLRFCNDHRLRQNEHQRAFVERRRRMRRVEMMPANDIWTQMELDDALDFGFESVEMEQLVADLLGVMGDVKERPEATSTLEALASLSINSIVDVIGRLPPPDI